MNNENFVIDHNKQAKVTNAINIAISYFEDNIPKTNGWIKSHMEENLKDLVELKKEIGNSFVVGHFE